MADTILDGSGEKIPGHRPLDGTDLEIAYNLLGDDLVLRVNKAGVQVFGVILEKAASDDCTAAPRFQNREFGSCRYDRYSRRRGCHHGLSARTGGEQVDKSGARESEQDLAEARIANAAIGFLLAEGPLLFKRRSSRG